MASVIVSPNRAAGILAIMTVLDGVVTTPGPCGGIGEGVAQTWMSVPEPEIILDIEAKRDVFNACSVASKPGAAGVVPAALVAFSAIVIALVAASLPA